MKKEQQDLLWQCLSKENREKERRAYSIPLIIDKNRSYCNALEDIFGSHNLTSDTEPEVMLHCSRNFVIGRYKHLTTSVAWNEGDVRAFQAEISLLKDLFGDKCLPDKELNEDNFAKSELEHRLEQTSVQAVFKPKFKVGDIAIHKGEVCTIEKVDIGEYPYKISKGGWITWVKESDLEPYTEENKKNCKETQNLSLSDEQPTENKETIVSKNDTMDDTKETMEDKELGKEDNFPTKELNLCELLKGCEREEVYSLLEGVTFIRNVGNALITTTESNNYGEKGNVYVGGECLLYPSKELYEKYPLDATQAWQEWASERKPKRWTPKNGEKFWHLNEFMNVVSSFYDEDDFDDHTIVNKTVNCFQSYELCQQAAEAVRETLEKFHKDHTEK